MKKKKMDSSIKNMSNTIEIDGKNKMKIANSKNKILLGCTSLSVTDFIYYNALMISDVIPLNSPVASIIKSSVATTASNMNNSNPIAFVSIRGQGLHADTL